MKQKGNKKQKDKMPRVVSVKVERLTPEKIKLSKTGKNKQEQVTRGHNIVADGWAGTSNLEPHPHHSPLSNSHTIPTAAS